ncbi:hypothetical protein ACTD5D_10160 [Nocardia takedensis]|uniref:hypothetical protein n=1 Tax=Nocardia takedensis TaxID=259390 RepID=UPI003F771264
MPQPRDSVELWFPLAAVLELAEHAMAAEQHAPYSTQAAGPSLICAKDDGIYLVSNGLPAQARTPADPAHFGMHAAHAHGHGSGTHWHGGPPLGDDFRQHLPLTTPVTDDGHRLIDLLRAAPTHRWLVIVMSTDTYYLELRTGAPN